MPVAPTLLPPFRDQCQQRLVVWEMKGYDAMD